MKAGAYKNRTALIKKYCRSLHSNTPNLIWFTSQSSNSFWSNSETSELSLQYQH